MTSTSIDGSNVWVELVIFRQCIFAAVSLVYEMRNGMTFVEPVLNPTIPRNFSPALTVVNDWSAFELAEID